MNYVQLLMIFFSLLAPIYSESEWMTIFNGKDFSGWNGDKNWFRIENGVVIAGKLDVDRIPHNYFLATNKKYQNFELKLKVKTVQMPTTVKTNGGIQIRSMREKGTTHMIGYQCDVGTGVWGAIYDEKRRKKFLTPKPTLKTIELAKINENEWNDYHIICHDNKIKIYINGHKTADYVEDDFSISQQKGYIGLQVHSTKNWPMEIHYKDLKLKQL